MRTKGAKNKVTIEMERLMEEGMDAESAKIQANVNLTVTKKVFTKSTPTEKVVKKKKISKKDIVYPTGIAGYNTTTKSAWLKSQNSTSRKHAIRAMCLMCVGGSGKEVTNCSMMSCPLYQFRITG